MTSELASRLESLINSKIQDYPLPLVNGNSIRIKNYVVRYSKKAGAWLVYDCKDHIQVGKFFAKTSAIAYAKVNASDNANLSSTVNRLDHALSKHYQDCVFYNHGMKKTKDDVKYDILSTRFDISYSIAREVKSQLDDIILY
tara:strand:+ start:4073 stop:4498 length:426 start_codon:yes stop_codon:yes gene_type:complete